MANIIFIEGLVNSMEEAIFKLERAISDGKKNEINRLRMLIIDLHNQINAELEQHA